MVASRSLLISLVVLCGAAAASAAGTNYAILVAGSNGYYNYRHQSDVCHAFQTLTDPTKGNIPAENIITFMYDDIANNPSNPTQGQLINHPDGPNVYKGVTKDYTGVYVTPANFLAVLAGNQSQVVGGSGRVLQSGPEDNVFIYFSDHGAPGLIAFPSDYLYAQDLINTLTYMNANKMYNKLVFYLEACESGSMFENLLPKNINVFATTASSATESSWGTYCPPDDMVNGKELNSCLGDLYSVNWMEDCDGQGLERTLEGQFEVVQQLTNLSHVTKYGTQTYASTDTVKEFLAPAKATATKASSSSSASKSSSNVDTHDVELVQDFYKYMRADKQGKTLEQKAALAEQLIAVVQARQAADEKYASLGEIVSATPADFEAHEVVDADCVKAAYTTFQAKCGKIDSYSLKYSHQVADLCTTFNADSIDAILTTLCQ